jgi:RNA polymerase sporulation-specific sigma factor
MFPINAIIAKVRRLLARIAPPRGVMYIGGADALPPPLSREEESIYIAMLSVGSHEAKQTLIERN